jgi:hypothetical protein
MSNKQQDSSRASSSCSQNDPFLQEIVGCESGKEFGIIILWLYVTMRREKEIDVETTAGDYFVWIRWPTKFDLRTYDLRRCLTLRVLSRSEWWCKTVSELLREPVSSDEFRYDSLKEESL